MRFGLTRIVAKAYLSQSSMDALTHTYETQSDRLAPVAEATTGALAWAATRVKVTRVGDPDGTLILFSAGGELREKPHEGETR